MSFSQSQFAARLQELVSRRREESGLYHETAGLLPLIDSGRLLDIGTGTGLQLRIIRQIKPGLELFGLDTSAWAIHIARNYLDNLEVDLRVGSIEKTGFETDFFDIVTCSSSMSYWQNLPACYDEIFRLLKPGGSAHLFEPRKNIDIAEAIETIRKNLQWESRLRIFLATSLNKFGLKRGSSVGLKLYSMDEINETARRTMFSEQVSVEPAILQYLPIFMQVTLRKLV